MKGKKQEKQQGRQKKVKKKRLKKFISHLFNKLVIIKINESDKNVDGDANAVCFCMRDTYMMLCHHHHHISLFSYFSLSLLFFSVRYRKWNEFFSSAVPSASSCLCHTYSTRCEWSVHHFQSTETELKKSKQRKEHFFMQKYSW